MTDPQDTWTYSFVANSNLLAQTASTVTTVLYSYENNRDVLTSIENKVGTTTVSEYAYAVSRNDWEELRPTDARQPEGCRRWASLASTFRINQRTNRTQSGTAFATSSDAFSYNTRGEVIGSVNDQINAREFDYAYDAIGNRQLSSKAGLETTYSVNMLNQYTAITLDGGTPSTLSRFYFR